MQTIGYFRIKDLLLHRNYSSKNIKEEKMRKRISIVLMGLMFCMAVSAQDKVSNSFFDRFVLELGVDAGSRQHDIAPMGVGVNVGYSLSSRFYLYARYQGMMGLYDNGDSKTYFNTQNIGGGVGFTFHKFR